MSVFFLIVSASAETRIALVIGNSNYTHAGKLANPGNDAEDIAKALTNLGFEVVKGTDLTIRGFANTLVDFSEKLKSADVALLFFAGHGVAVNEKNYLIPVDAELNSAADLDVEAIALERVQAIMESRPRTNILIFDACRNNPFTRRIARSLGARSGAVQEGWAALSPAKGTYISFGTEPGNVASDGSGRNSPFTAALLRHIATPDLDVQLMMRPVRREVIEATGGDQVPWEHSSLIASFSFARQVRQAAVPFLESDKASYAQGGRIRLHITPPQDCRLTLFNVDNAGKSCVLFPHPELPDTILTTGERFVYPPKGSLTLGESGEETFVAMCNASDEAKQAAARDTQKADCSKGVADRNFNDKVFELATFDPHDDGGTTASTDAPAEKPTVLSESLTVTVAPR